MQHYSIEQLIWIKFKETCISPSRTKAATAIALGLWEPDKVLQESTIFKMKPTGPVAIDLNVYNASRQNSPVRLGPPPGLNPVPEFVNIQLGNDNDEKPPKIYPINKNLFTQYCGQFNITAKENKNTPTFQLQPPALGPAGISENALDMLFPLFSIWLHGGQLTARDGTPARHLGLLTLCRLYVFGMLLEAPLFSNAVVDVIKTKKQHFTIFSHAAVEDAIMYVYGFPYIELRAAIVDFVIVNSGAWIVDAFGWPSIAKKDMLDALFSRGKESIETAVVDDKSRHHIQVED